MSLSAHRPSTPSRVVASELLHGDDEGFIVNAYLALQRQWPDPGGYAHYHYLLSQQPGQRARVLRELAASETAGWIGVRMEDDLPADHVYRADDWPAEQREALYRLASQRWRLQQLVQESRETRDLLSRVTLEGIGAAVQTLVESCQSQMGQLESRLATLQAEMQSLREQVQAMPVPATPPLPDWTRDELLRLARRQQALEQRVERLPEDSLLPAVGGELKRQLADYITALCRVQVEQALTEALARQRAADREDEA